MAPRTAKSKKAADIKVTENEAPKKGRGKAKDVDEVEQELPEVELNGKVAATDKKSKRGKKANESNEEHTNGEETAPPVKRGRKKQVDEPVLEEKIANGDHSHDEESQASEGAQNEEDAEINGHAEEAPVSTGKGRKKQTKKEEKPEAKPKEATRGRKAKQEIGAGDAEEKEENKEVVEEKPKSKGRGRKAPPKADAEPETEEKTDTLEEEVKVEPVATKGRKKTQPKEKALAKEKSPESEKEEPKEQIEEQAAEDSKKKEIKGKKGQGKKAQSKEMSEEKEEVEKEEPATKKRKINRKDEKGSGDAKDEANEEVSESKPKSKRGKKAVEAAAQSLDEEPQDTGEEAVNKRKRKPAEEKAEDKKPAMNKHATNYEETDFSNNSKTAQGKEWNFKIASWNVDGIRAWLGKGGLDYLKYEKPDIFCLQETKCPQDKLPDEVVNVPGYHAYWLSSDKDGYAGVGIYTTRLAMNVQYGLQDEEFDHEGRIITAEYEHFYLICTYVPNAGRGLVTLPKRLKWNEAFRKYVKELDMKKPVIICGDMNVAHNEIDIANPKSNKKNAGFTPEERAGMTDLLSDGFADTFRHLYPDRAAAYTFWSYMKSSRSKNVGWRLDYFIVSERLLSSVCDHVIRDEVYGSDHCPIALFLHLSSADKPTE